MRLLNASTLCLSEFPGNDVPPYAILSHTWSKEEITFQDIQDPHSSVTRSRAGFRKLQGCCDLARQHGFEYVWIDTCCINKDSSAELSEAINSMYGYYQDAEVCYAYLSDVSRHHNPRSFNSSFRICRWFTRGWTLQELLAPSTVIFFDADWTEIGTKSSLQDVITAMTGIPPEVLSDDNTRSISIATKMSWAAMRETTREEDRAYCLMGIFGVHMPTLYGEGLSNAFMRLQLEIIKFSHDRSIFAWRAPVDSTEERGLLAKSPFEFRSSGDVGISDDSYGVSSFSMTNNGLHIQLPMEFIHNEGDDLFLAFLDCQTKEGNEHLGIYLRKVGHLNQNQFVRCWPDEIELRVSSRGPKERTNIYVKENSVIRRKKSRPKNYTFTVKPVPGLVGLAIQQQSYVWQSTEQEEGEETGKIPFWGGLDREITLSVSNGSDITLLFLDEVTGEKFTVIVGVHNLHIFSDIATNVGLGMSPLEHELLKQSYTLGDRRHILERGLDRVSKPFGDSGVVSVAIRKRVQPGEYDIDIDVAPGQLSVAKELLPPRCGFLIMTESLSDCSLREVYPPDIFPPLHGDPETLVNVYHHAEGFHASRMLFFETFWDVPKQVAVFLGVQDSGRVWTDIVIESGKSGVRSAEEIWSTYHQSGGAMEKATGIRTVGTFRRWIRTMFKSQCIPTRKGDCTDSRNGHHRQEDNTTFWITLGSH
ncbi:HET-domain-containing protein [Dendrothele bispora CBS 962.96]|uniref:HET-domain-containing protein n=1 Tax=Dendrothele bispora (strain CBS 962.96) TaxID=1314807 RepID=A0A4V4HGX9_DENBC|nr:HET-domain-containing protein [Dendrothele bispora CBS 962.96]